MDKHSVAVAAHEERNGFVHQLVLGAHAVACRDENALTAFVEARKRFAATEYLLVVLEFESGREAAREIVGAADKRERNGAEVGCGLTEILRACQQAAALIVNLDTPRLFVDSHAAMRTRVNDLALVLFNSPRVVLWNRPGEHQRLSICYRNVPRGDSQTQRARTDETDRKRQGRILIVFGRRKLTGLPTHETNVDFVERKRCIAPVAVPQQRPLARCRVERSDAAPDEVHVVGPLKIQTDVYRIAEHLRLNNRRSEA